MTKNNLVFNFPKATLWYQKILEAFGFDSAQDLRARDILWNLLTEPTLSSNLEKMAHSLAAKPPLFFGAGPNLRDHITCLESDLHLSWNQYFIVASDGAAGALTAHDITPDLIVSDLDGLTYSQVQFFLEKGVLFLIHAHGDNMEKLREFQDLLQSFPNIIGTTQTPPRMPIINAGGFTDGDRGVYLCHHLAPLSVEFWLFGYEFGEYIGQDSKIAFNAPQPMTPLKKKKLRFCHDLLADLTTTYHRPIHYFQETIKKFSPIIRN